MVLELTLIGFLTVTSYQSVPEQTDDSPFITSIGERTHPGGCAASRDLLGLEVKYGDYIYIDGLGLCRINDTMHPRIKRTIDVWVKDYASEKRIGVRRGTRIYKVKLPSTQVVKR